MLCLKCYVMSVTNWGNAGLGTGERPASETGSTDDGLLVSSKNKHNPNRAPISVRIIVPFFLMASRPLSVAHQLNLTIYNV